MQLKLLLVSADRDTQRELGVELSRLGFAVLAAESMADGLELCRSSNPSVVLLDAGLLGNGGLERLFDLRRDCPGNEVIMLANEPDLPLSLQALELEAGDIIPLPVDPPDLESSIEAALQRQRIKAKLTGLKRQIEESSFAGREPAATIRERIDRLIDLEREEVAQQLVDGLGTALRRLMGKVESSQSFFGEFPCFVSIHNQRRKVVAANRLARDKLGDVVGKDSWQACSRERLDRNQCPVNLTFDLGESQFSHEVLTDSSGGLIPVMVYTVPVKNQDGEVTLVLAMAADMSEVKRFKNELFAMQRRYQQLFDEAPCFISVQDQSLRVTAANRRFKEAFGEEIGRPCHELYKGQEQACSVCPVKRTFLYGEPQSSEELLTGKDGTDYSVLTHTAPIRNGNGDITHVMEMSLDITRTKALQKELEEARHLYQTLFDEVPCYISVQDRDFRLTATNRRFKEDFGDDVGSYCYEIYKHRNSPCNECPVAATFSDGEQHSTEEVVTSKSGEKIYTLTWTAPIRDVSGRITHVMEMSTDITQIREMQDHLTSLGLLIGSMSHGVKGLLTGLDGGIYMMNSGFANSDQERIEEGWQTVKLMVDRIKSTVMDILYYAKKRELKWECVDALNLAVRAATSVRPKAESHGIEFVESFQACSVELEVDSSVVASALVNLLENAVDACVEDQPGKDHRIVFSLSTTPHEVVFEIQDNGMGMDEETRNNIFTLFFSSKGSSGTGLGLYIASQVIEQHGGSIEVESTPGQGSSFRVRLLKEIPHQIKMEQDS